MNKSFIHIAFIFAPIIIVGQSATNNKKWQEERKYLEYKKAEKYKGPDDWYGTYPADMSTNDDASEKGFSTNQGIQYNPQKIQRDRQKRYQGFDKGGGKGTLKFDPKVERPQRPDMPDFDPPNIKTPDFDVDAPTISPTFWKVLLFLLIFGAVLAFVYLFIRNRRPTNKKILVDVDNDWNPEIVTKTELEQRLDEAILKNDFRECVRIYFTFILKELIRKSWIHWKKNKTNFHYVLEMRNKEDHKIFEECVRIYDLVWYGEYRINEEIFSNLEPIFQNYYKSLQPADEQ